MNPRESLVIRLKSIKPPAVPPLRIKFLGPIYHATSPGDPRRPIYRRHDSRSTQVEVAAQAMDGSDAQVLACYGHAIASIWRCTPVGPIYRS